MYPILAFQVKHDYQDLKYLRFSCIKISAALKMDRRTQQFKNLPEDRILDQQESVTLINCFLLQMLSNQVHSLGTGYSWKGPKRKTTAEGGGWRGTGWGFLYPFLPAFSSPHSRLESLFTGFQVQNVRYWGSN